MFIENRYIYFCEGKIVIFFELMSKYFVNKLKYIPGKLILELFRIDFKYNKEYEYLSVDFKLVFCLHR